LGWSEGQCLVGEMMDGWGANMNLASAMIFVTLRSAISSMRLCWRKAGIRSDLGSGKLSHRRVRCLVGGNVAAAVGSLFAVHG
jgi:hypothetical protein